MGGVLILSRMSEETEDWSSHVKLKGRGFQARGTESARPKEIC